MAKKKKPTKAKPARKTKKPSKPVAKTVAPKKLEKARDKQAKGPATGRVSKIQREPRYLDFSMPERKEPRPKELEKLDDVESEPDE